MIFIQQVYEDADIKSEYVRCPSCKRGRLCDKPKGDISSIFSPLSLNRFTIIYNRERKILHFYLNLYKILSKKFNLASFEGEKRKGVDQH